MNFSKLNLAPVQKIKTRNPITSRRESLIKGIDKQLNACEQLLSGKLHPTDSQTGRKIPIWFWLDESGNYYVSINYGKKPLELSKGKFSIVCENIEQVKSALLLTRDIVVKGGFDQQLSDRSKAIRGNFNR